MTPGVFACLWFLPPGCLPTDYYISLRRLDTCFLKLGKRATTQFLRASLPLACSFVQLFLHIQPSLSVKGRVLHTSKCITLIFWMSSFTLLPWEKNEAFQKESQLLGKGQVKQHQETRAFSMWEVSRAGWRLPTHQWARSRWAGRWVGSFSSPTPSQVPSSLYHSWLQCMRVFHTVHVPWVLQTQSNTGWIWETGTCVIKRSDRWK